MVIAVCFVSGMFSRTMKEAWVLAITGKQLWSLVIRGMLLAKMGAAAPVRKHSRLCTNK